MSYYRKILKETVEAINQYYKKNITDVTVKRIRKCYNIPSSDRSKINFISRALEDLKKMGFLHFVGRNSPKKYRIIHKINVKDVMERLNFLKKK